MGKNIKKDKSKYLVEVIGLNKSFGKKKVLHDISFSIKPNEILGFIGPNGAGKSTAMKCICNLIYPDSGTIIINGYDLFEEREKALSQQAALIESPGLYMDMTGRENINLIGKLRKISKERIKEIYDFTEIGEALDRKVSGYSMGMKQRLGLGIAIMSKPKFLMLDEPSSGLDPTGIIHLRSTLENLVKTEDISILFSSHQLGEVEKLADRIICINKGKLVEPPKAFAEQYSYIMEFNDIDKAYNIISSKIKPDKIRKVGNNALRVELENSNIFNILLKELMEGGVDIVDITKDRIDIETIYKDVYGG